MSSETKSLSGGQKVFLAVAVIASVLFMFNRSQHLKVEEMKQDAYQSGCDADFRGGSILDNPFINDDPRKDEWTDGFTSRGRYDY